MRFAVLLLVLAATTPAAAQTRANQIAAEFTKTKDQTKTKHGVTLRKYKEVLSVPWRVGSLSDYAGRYVSLGDPMYLAVNIGASGVVSAHGNDSDAFEIRNPRIEDAVLYGTKVYRDGRTESFEAGFLKRSHRAAPGEPFTVSFGVGVLVDAPRNMGITGSMHVFLMKQ
jgi:hypothetical protein